MLVICSTLNCRTPPLEYLLHVQELFSSLSSNADVGVCTYTFWERAGVKVPVGEADISAPPAGWAEVDMPVRGAEVDMPVRGAEVDVPVRGAEVDVPVTVGAEVDVTVRVAEGTCR